MQIKIHLKHPGKRRNAVREEIYTVSDGISTLRELIADIAARQVKEFNEKAERGRIINYLTAGETEDLAGTGKASFGELMNKKKQDPGAAVKNALQSFEDGLYCVFIDGGQKESLEDKIYLTEDSVLTFVRLTMLAGRM